MPEHNVITDPYIHEPKGIATASAGDVYVANGAGGGVWVPGGGAEYGEMIIDYNTTPIALTAAVDSTLETASDYVKVDSGIWATGPVRGITFNSSGYLEVATAGLYEISFWTCFTTSVTGTICAIRYSATDSVANLSARKLLRKAGTAGDIGSVAASGFAVLPAGAKVSMWVAATGNCNFTAEEAGLTLTLLKAD